MGGAGGVRYVRFSCGMSDVVGDAMSEPQLFLEDGSQFGISREAFAAMDEDKQRELKLQWFHENFEDPRSGNAFWDNETKEYVYLWGGPFDAQEQLWNKFGEIVPEALIENIREEVESHGTFEWAPGAVSPFYKGDDDEKLREPPSLDIYIDEPSERYGSPEEREARARAREAIENLRQALESRRAIGIGHNRPPDEETEEPDEIIELWPALQGLSAELAKPNPAISVVKRWATPLRDALIACAKWGLNKIDGAIDAGLKAGAIAGIGWLATQYSEPLHKAFDAVLAWLDIAAKTLF
jgi:hypothetical protein